MVYNKVIIDFEKVYENHTKSLFPNVEIKSISL